MTLSSIGQLPAVTIQTTRVPEAAQATASSVEVSMSAAPEVQISKEGRDTLEREKYADIDKAPLPDDVKEMLKNIRKLQEKIAEKSQELMDVMTDKTLSDDDRKRQQQALTAQLHAMQSAMGQATNALNNAMSLHNLNPKDRSLAKGLVGMK